jgi:hypothetical protein
MAADKQVLTLCAEWARNGWLHELVNCDKVCLFERRRVALKPCRLAWE